ncbi:CD244 protein, partial [Alectura lathami]|nr:CD244 protein [Alectura lathami]
LGLLLCVVLGVAGGWQGCGHRAASAGGELQLLLEEPLLEWEKITWRKELEEGGKLQRILTAVKNQTESTNSSLARRATFHLDTLSLRISPVTKTDSGSYSAEFVSSSGSISTQCFQVSVWEPVGRLYLEARMLQQEQGWCNLSCTVLGATDASYSWSHNGEPLGNQSVLRVHRDVEPGLYECNASNPVSWSSASINAVAACIQPGLFSVIPWWAAAVVLVLAVSIAASIACWCWRRRRRRRKDGPTAPLTPTETSLTVYEEVGKARTGRGPNGNSEAAVVGNTVYAVVYPKAQGPGRPWEPESRTIYSTIEPSRRVSAPSRRCSAPQSSSKRKKLDPALVSTAYMEVT